MTTKPFLTLSDIERSAGITRPSARVYCSRQVSQGSLIRCKNNLYVTKDTFARAGASELFMIANHLQSPSYISCTTALSYYGITTQVQQGFIESISLKRTRTYQVGTITFDFKKISAAFYGGFTRTPDGFFIATREKAFIDMVYLFSFGKYSFDRAALDLAKLDRTVITDTIARYPAKTRKIVERLFL